MKELIKIVELKDLDQLAPVRTLPGLQGCIDGNQIFLRGIFINDKELPVTLKIPAIKTYRLAQGNLLFPLDGVTPVAKMEEMNWKPLHKLLPLKLPTAAFTGKLREKIKIELIESESPKEIYASLYDTTQWFKYCKEIPEARLKQIRFALSKDEKILVLNSGIISLPAQHFWKSENNLLPLGYDFNPPILSELISKKLNSENENFLLFNKDASYSLISLFSFMQGAKSIFNVLSSKLEE